MKASPVSLALIKKHEGLRLSSYKCPAGVWTIGYGNTRYPDGTPVKEGEAITMMRAEQLLEYDLGQKAAAIAPLFIAVRLRQTQQDAILSFVYNVGVAAFKRSTLLRLIQKKTDDLRIRTEFERWVWAKGRKLSGLVRRRKEEADLYYS